MGGKADACFVGGGKEDSHERERDNQVKMRPTYLLPLRSFSCMRRNQSVIENNKQTPSTLWWWLFEANGRACHGRARDPNHNTAGASGDLLTLTIASLIISILMESADVRDANDVPIAFTRWGGRSGSVKTYHGRRRERREWPSWSRRLLSWEA